MSATVRVRLRNNYGRQVIYPANEAATALADIAGTATLSPQVLRTAKERLGLTVETYECDASIVSNLIGGKCGGVRV